MSYRMTERRFETVEDVLELYRSHFIQAGRFDVHGFENKIKRHLNLHYKQAEQVLTDLYRTRSRFALMVLYYMEHHGTPGPPSALQSVLADAYGCSRYGTDECNQAKSDFWSRFATPEARERGLDAED